MLAGCSSDGIYRQAEGSAWHTLYHITYQSPRELDDSIRVVIDSIDSSLSFFNPESELSAINSATGDIEVSEAIRDVYTLSRRVWLMTDSVFDPSVAPAISAWGFGKGHKVSPDTLALDSLRSFVGLEKTNLTGTVIHKDDPRVEFNFSAVAKGYGVDRIAAMMERNGVGNYLIEVGGEIRASGVNQNGRLWRVAIDCPREDSRAGEEAVETVSFTDMGIATSGNYRNYHSATDGSRFGHTISPRSLRPVRTDILSVTVMASTCAEADALATAAMAMGFRKASALLDSLKLPAVFVMAGQDSASFSVIPNKPFREMKRAND